MEQQLPHNLEAETAVIGSVLIDTDAFYAVSGFLRPDAFYDKRNGAIFKAVSDLHSNSRAVDVLTVAELIKARNGDDLTNRIIDAVTMTPTSTNCETYGKIVESLAVRRQLIRNAGSMAKLAYDTGSSIDGVLGESTRLLFEVSDNRAGDNVRHVSGVMGDLFDEVQKRYSAGGIVPGIVTGYHDLDNILDGFQGSRLYVIAARPAMGKSALMNGCALGMARRGVPVAMFNLEMGDMEIGTRLAAMVARIDSGKIGRGELSQDEFGKLSQGIGELSKMPIYIDDAPGLTPVQLRAKARRLYAENGIKALFVDYLGLMSGDGTYQSKVIEVGDITRQLKMIAKELDIPVIALAQLSRKVEDRQKKIPQLSDLRDSGNIEEHADCVIFLYRDEYYNPDTTERPNQADVIVAKNRGGKLGTAVLYWHSQYTLFANLQAEKVNL